MADNVIANAGAGGATFAADDIGSVYYPRTKITLGADGSADGDVSSANPMPITGTLTGVTTLTGGSVAHDAVDSGNPIKIGGRALASLKTATLVASGDRIDQIYDLDGAQMVRNGVPLGDVLNESKTLSTSAATNFSTFNGSSGVKNCITSITVTNSHATTFGSLQLKDGSGGAAFWTLPAPASGGGHFTFDPPLKQTSVATALGVQLQPNVADVVVCVNGYQSKA